MNWIKDFVRPRFAGVFRKGDDTPDNLWENCKKCGEIIFHRDLAHLQNVCPSCHYHMRIGAKMRFAQTFDEGKYEIIPLRDVAHDPLQFKDQKKYSERLKEARQKAAQKAIADNNPDVPKDAVQVGKGAICGIQSIVAVQDFAFMGGSLGMAAGEAVITAAETAHQAGAPLIMFTAAGGARMQEGILSLMQMPRTTVAIQRLREAGLPYIVVLTDPTTGGVTASYAMLGDVQIAEPGALIGFAGPRVIEDTIKETLPDGFQRAEYLLAHGMIDMVVHRHQLRDTLGRLVALLTGQKSTKKSAKKSAAL